MSRNIQQISTVYRPTILMGFLLLQDHWKENHRTNAPRIHMMIHKILHISFSRLNGEQSLNAGFGSHRFTKLSACNISTVCWLHQGNFATFANSCSSASTNPSTTATSHCRIANMQPKSSSFSADWVGNFHPTIGSSLYQHK